MKKSDCVDHAESEILPKFECLQAKEDFVAVLEKYFGQRVIEWHKTTKMNTYEMSALLYTKSEQRCTLPCDVNESDFCLVKNSIKATSWKLGQQENIEVYERNTEATENSVKNFNDGYCDDQLLYLNNDLIYIEKIGNVNDIENTKILELFSTINHIKKTNFMILSESKFHDILQSCGFQTRIN